MTDYEAIGRYYVAVKKAKELVSKRNNALTRLTAVISNVTQYPAHNTQIIGKHCNFDTLQNLLTEAKSINDELMMLIEEINSLAPIAEESEVKLD